MNHPIDTQISPVWKVCLKEAWETLYAGFVPAGVAWVDTDSTIIRGRNRIDEPLETFSTIAGTRVGHAQINVLAQIPTEQYLYMKPGPIQG